MRIRAIAAGLLLCGAAQADQRVPLHFVHPPPNPMRTVGIVTMSVGVLGTLAGISMLWKALYRTQIDDGLFCSNQPPQCRLDMKHDRETWAMIGGVMFGAGLVTAVGIGLPLIQLAPKSRAMVVPTGMGASLVGRF